MERALKNFASLFIVVFALNAGAQTAVLFPLAQMTGTTNDTTITIRPVNNPVKFNSQIYWLPTAGLQLKTVNGSATTNLIPNDYSVTIAGIPGSWKISVNDTNVTLNAALIGNLTTYTFTDLFSYVKRIVPGPSGNITVSPSNGEGVVTVDVPGGGGGGGASQGAINVSSNSIISTVHTIDNTSSNTLAIASATMGANLTNDVNSTSNSIIGTSQTSINTTSNSLQSQITSGGVTITQLNASSNSIVGTSQTAINTTSNSVVGTSQTAINTSSNSVVGTGQASVNAASNTLAIASATLGANATNDINSTSNTLAGLSQTIANTSSNAVLGNAQTAVNTTSNSLQSQITSGGVTITQLNASSNSIVGTSQTAINTSSNSVLANAQTAINTSSNSVLAKAQTAINTTSNTLAGVDATKAPLASPSFTGNVTISGDGALLTINGDTSSADGPFVLDSTVADILSIRSPTQGNSLSIDSNTSDIRAESGWGFTGDGSGLLSLNASQLMSGLIAHARFPFNVTTNKGTLASTSLLKGDGGGGVTNATPGVDYPTIGQLVPWPTVTNQYLILDVNTNPAATLNGNLWTNWVAYTHEGTTTNLIATFNGTLQTFTVTNGPDVFLSYAGANGSVSYRFTTNVNLHFSYVPKWLAGSNSVITNGVLSLSSYGGTNAAQIEAAMKENQ